MLSYSQLSAGFLLQLLAAYSRSCCQLTPSAVGSLLPQSGGLKLACPPTSYISNLSAFLSASYSANRSASLPANLSASLFPTYLSVSIQYTSYLQDFLATFPLAQKCCLSACLSACVSGWFSQLIIRHWRGANIRPTWCPVHCTVYITSAVSPRPSSSLPSAFPSLILGIFSLLYQPYLKQQYPEISYLRFFIFSLVIEIKF